MHTLRTLLLQNRSGFHRISARFNSFVPLALTESQFEAAAVKELTDIANNLEYKADDLGIDSVEVHEGVLTVEFAKGTFIVNKHQASRQIWYSSPVSPPAYFDPISQPGMENWWSKRLNRGLRAKFFLDIKTLTGLDVK
jgi:frataxin-like iron-binding protein CyaY